MVVAFFRQNRRRDMTSLRSKCFRAYEEHTKTFSIFARARISFLRSPQFSRGQKSKKYPAAYAPRMRGNACYAGYDMTEKALQFYLFWDDHDDLF